MMPLSKSTQHGRAAPVTLALPEGHDFAEIKGSAMAPELQPGALVVVDRRCTKPEGPGIYYFWDGLGMSPMRIDACGRKGFVAVWCDDKNFQRYELPIGSVRVGGRIVGVFKQL